MKQFCPHMGYVLETIWCPDCWDESQRDRLVSESIRANDLKERELDQQDSGWIEPRPQPQPQPRQTYVLPTATPAARGANTSVRWRDS